MLTKLEEEMKAISPPEFKEEEEEEGSSEEDDNEEGDWGNDEEVDLN